MSNEIHSVSDIDVDAMLEKYGAKVVWDDKAVFVDGKGAEQIRPLPPQLCGWTVVHKGGAIDLSPLREISDARLAAALFLYLWGDKGVPVAIAHRCAKAHVAHYSVSPLDEDDREQLRRLLRPDPSDGEQ